MTRDNKTIISSITDMLSNDVKYKKTKLVGDKGYASKLEHKVKLLNDFKVELIYSKKLKNVFSDLKKYDRIYLSMESKLPAKDSTSLEKINWRRTFTYSLTLVKVIQKQKLCLFNNYVTIKQLFAN